ncbi:D-galactoside-specific lectin-like isoform X2 [Ostrea edulis]|uniref:D-galactoside-specific lectin-like isoform X2 n=1 Tax=Ostrea edulis TaxID=37623 RepID=UPI0024AEBA9D|nr:D-galactoside-specific lectin-like isoform X2 [Ostrea edulis]
MRVETYWMGIILLLSIISLGAGGSIVIICENHNAYLRCPPSHTIRILSANYGRTERYICPARSRWMRDFNCHSSNSQVKVMSRCDSHTECFLEAKNSVFGDPCVGTYKYLYVEFFCEETTAVPA